MAETKAGDLKAGVRGGNAPRTGPAVRLFVGACPGEKPTSRMFVTGSSGTNYHRAPSEAESDILFLLVCVSKKPLSGPWRDSAWAWKRHAPKGRGQIYNCKLSKITALGEGSEVSSFWPQHAVNAPGRTELRPAGTWRGLEAS